MAITCPKCHSDNTDTARYCNNCATALTLADDIQPSFTKTLETPLEELNRGTLFAGRYEIIEELGRGGMGRVYRAEDTKVREEVALKLIRPEISADRKTIDRFRDELKVARKIRHKNVTGMYDLGEDKGTYYITMEYVTGEDLKSFIRRSGQLSIGTSIKVAKQICEGLSEAHRLGIVHRDLKPSNIMIDENGNARIMDFGIARSLEVKSRTEVGVMIGTPEYMSPEQVEGRDVNQRSDIYSLGVILYEMVTSQVPFKGDAAHAIALKHKSELPRHPSELSNQIPEDLETLILRCMEKEEGKRFQSAAEVISELARIEKEKFDTKPTARTEARTSIAVLPFTDLSPQKDQEYFCDGMAEELSNTLSKIDGIMVASRTSSFQFKDKGYDIREVGRKLKVQTVLEGSVRKSGDRLRITAQLVNIEDGFHLWSDRYDRDMKDIFAVQDEISLAIVEKLKIRLLGGEKEKIIKRYAQDPEAYNLYLKGRFFWNKRTEEGMKRAIGFFEQAISLDSGLASAYTGLADCYLVLPYYSPLSPREAIPKAKAAASRALEIDNNIAEAHASMGMLKMYDDRDWRRGEEEIKRALELNPNYVTAHFWNGWFLIWKARLEEGIEQLKKALALEPLSLVINDDLGLAYYYARRFDLALAQFNKTLELDASHVYTHMYMGWAYLQKAMHEEALAEMQREEELSKSWSPLVKAWIAIAFIHLGKEDKSREILESLVTKAKQVYVSPYHIALIYFVLGENDRGFEWMDEAYKERDYWLNWLKVEPLLNNVRNDLRFIQLLKNMNLD